MSTTSENDLSESEAPIQTENTDDIPRITTYHLEKDNKLLVNLD